MGGGIYLAYGNDLFKGAKLCTFPILSRHTCDLLGEPYPVAYPRAFIDYHLFDIFKRLQRAGHDRIRYLEDVIFENIHYRTGKVAVDETYTKRGRFDDDSTFMALIQTRQYEAIRYEEVIPPNPILALTMYTSRLLFDGELPWCWRSWLWV